MVRLPVEQRGQDEVVPYVIRSLLPCPCRQIPETRQGVFWNPNLNNFAIAYRRCRGDTTTDIYAQLQSNLSSVITSGAAPSGTARAGTDINIAGRNVGGRVVLEVLGTNQSGAGIGGHGQLVVQGQDWLVFVDAEFIRRVGQLAPGTDPNEVTVRSGVNVWNTQVGVDVSHTGGNTQVLLTLRIPTSTPRVRDEHCVTCYCPPPSRRYTCIDFMLDREEPVASEVVTHPLGEYRFYFRLDTTAPEPALQAESTRNLSEMATAISNEGVIELITGYASPEAPERHNQDLSARRGQALAERVQQQLGPGVPVPPPSGAGELLGRRPAASPSSRLGDVITQNGFRSAEDLTFLLLGEEIPNAELSSQFISLFNALPEPADRLAVFGLAADDPAAPQVLASIDQFVRSRGLGYRPWERIFQRLRVGVVRVRRTVRTPQIEIVRHEGTTTQLTDDACRPRAAVAEAQQPGFGPIADSALRPTPTPEQSRTDCRDEPTRSEIEQGCNYTPPSGRSTGGLTAPGVAPRPFGQIQ
jgi:hypothetical protein